MPAEGVGAAAEAAAGERLARADAGEPHAEELADGLRITFQLGEDDTTILATLGGRARNGDILDLGRHFDFHPAGRLDVTFTPSRRKVRRAHKKVIVYVLLGERDGGQAEFRRTIRITSG